MFQHLNNYKSCGGAVQSAPGRTGVAEEQMNEKVNRSFLEQGGSSVTRQNLSLKPAQDKRESVYIIDLENEDALAESRFDGLEVGNESRGNQGDTKERNHIHIETRPNV